MTFLDIAADLIRASQNPLKAVLKPLDLTDEQYDTAAAAYLAICETWDKPTP